MPVAAVVVIVVAAVVVMVSPLTALLSFTLTLVVSRGYPPTPAVGVRVRVGRVVRGVRGGLVAGFVYAFGAVVDAADYDFVLVGYTNDQTTGRRQLTF